MKRQKRILAGAAAMLLALGMLISCDTPANSGSSDGGSDGGSITLPEGNPEAENKLVGTWVQEDNAYNVVELKENGTGSYYRMGDVTWTATQKKLFFVCPFSKEELGDPISIELLKADTLSVKGVGMNDSDLDLSAAGTPTGSAEGTWEANVEGSSIKLTITTDSFEMITTGDDSSQTFKTTISGTYESNKLTPIEGAMMRGFVYQLKGDKLTFNNLTYTKQQ